jgi:hypothetical protein
VSLSLSYPNPVETYLTIANTSTHFGHIKSYRAMAGNSDHDLIRDGSHRTGQETAKGKGKEKEEPSQAVGQDQDPNGGSSLVSRIANSTVGLTNDCLTNAMLYNWRSVLASTVSEQKGSASTSAPLQSHHEGSSFGTHPEIWRGHQAAFRPEQAQSHAAAEEAAFSDFLDSTPVFQPGGSSEMEVPWQQSKPTSRTVPLDHFPATFTSVAEQERHDGEAVIALLMDADEHLPDQLDDNILDPGERENLRKALFGQSDDSTTQRTDWDHVLNFIPSYCRERGEVPSDGSNTLETFMNLGTRDPSEAWQTWVGQWADVLTRYTDEVWGDLGSLVEEARQEVDQLQKPPQDGPLPETKALQRLRAILGHLRVQ